MEGQYIPEGALGKVWRVLDRCIMFTTVVGSLASVMFIGAMFLNVIMRYVFSSPIWWFDEMIIALLVWYSALGTVVCYWTNEHAVIHFFLKFINRTGKLFFMFIPHVVVAITSLVFVSGGITLFGLQVTKLPQGGLPFTKAHDRHGGNDDNLCSISYRRVHFNAKTCVFGSLPKTSGRRSDDR